MSTDKDSRARGPRWKAIQRSCEHEDLAFDARRIDTDRLGGVFVLADSHAVITDARALDPGRYQQRNRE